jgi:hypothetical protein
MGLVCVFAQSSTQPAGWPRHRMKMRCRISEVEIEWWSSAMFDPRLGRCLWM